MNLFKILMISTSLLSLGNAADDGNPPANLTIAQINEMPDAELKALPNLSQVWKHTSTTATAEEKRGSDYKMAQAKTSRLQREILSDQRAARNATANAITENQAAAQRTGDTITNATDQLIQAQGQIGDLNSALNGIRDLLHQMAGFLQPAQEINAQIEGQIRQLTDLQQRSTAITDAQREQLRLLQERLTSLQEDHAQTNQDYEAIQRILDLVQ